MFFKRIALRALTAAVAVSVAQTRMKLFSKLRRYGLAPISCGIALAVAKPLDAPSPCFSLAVIVSSLYGGQGPGLLSVGLSALAFAYFFLPPTFGVLDPTYDLQFAIFLASTLVITWLVGTKGRAEKARSEQASLLNLTHDTVFVRDMSDVITYWNRGAEELYGWTQQEALGKVTHQLMQTIFPAPLTEINEELIRTGRWEGELVHTKRDGMRVVVASRWSLQQDEQRRPLAILETNNNITERKRAEAALQEQASLLNLTHDSIFVRDMNNSVVTYWNRGAEELYGWTAEKAVGKVSHQLLQTVFPAPLDKVEAELLRTGRWEGELVQTKADGTQVVVASRWSLQQDERQRPLAILELNNDITERKRTETELRESESRYRYIFESTGVSIWEEDFSQVKIAFDDLKANGVQDLRQYLAAHPQFVEEAISMVKILDVNDATVGLFGAQDKQELLVSLDKIFTPETQQVFMGELIALAQGRTSFKAQTSLRTLKGDRISVVFTVTFPPAPAKLNSVLVSIMDVTEQKRAEEALRQAQADLEHVNRVTTMGELTASLAHEVNQPLSAIVANGHACLRWLSGDVPNLAKAREAAERIVRDGKEAGEVVRRVRALFKRTAGERAALDLNEVIAEVLHLLRSDAAKRGVIVETDLDKTLPSVVGDHIQLKQVLLNLVLNGVEAMDPVFDRPKRLFIRSSRECADAVVEIRDHGVGMQNPEKVFEAFFTTKVTGMGMGLAICRSIIDAHQGRLWIASSEGPGAKVCFTIPLQSGGAP